LKKSHFNVGGKVKSETDILNSIRKALWILVVMFSILSLAWSGQLAANIYWWINKGRFRPEQALRVVVARKDMSEGTIIQPDDIGMRSMRVGELPDHFVCIHMARIIAGHKVLANIKRGEPLDLENTDLWRQNPQQDN
jgi:Flp pilus assembly protein CpaB